MRRSTRRSSSGHRSSRLSILGFALLAAIGVGCGGPNPGDDLLQDLPWVKKVTFEGNRAFSDGHLRSIMSLEPPSTLRPFRRNHYFRDLLDRDLADIRDAYRDRGYLSFQVTGVEEIFAPEHETVELVITVSEGEQTIVRGIEFAGVEHLARKRLMDVIRTRVGRPFSPFVAQGDLERIRAAYLDDGYFFADPSLSLRPQGANIHVVYEVVEGKQVRLRFVDARGNVNTKEHYITREVTIGHDELYERQKILETQKRLGELGLFSLVRPQTVVVDSAAGLVDLRLEVRERKHGWYGFGFGFNSNEQVRLTAEWGHRNVWGTARRIRALGSIGWDVDSLFTDGASRASTEHEASVTWVEPWFLGTRTEGSFGVFRSFKQQPQAFRSTTNGVRATFRRDLSRYVDLFLTLENEWVSSNDTTFAREDFVTRSVRVEVERDTRDNILDPRRGSLQTGRVRYAGLGGEVDYVETVLSTSHALPKQSGRRVVAFGLKLGYIEPVGSDPVVGDALDDIPYQDRFFIGGATSLRGYRREDVGIREDGTTRGGRVLFLANAELRFPIVWRFRGGLFVDAGNIWGNPRDLKIGRLWGEFLGTYSPLDIRYTAGAGVRIRTPVGPFRIDYARKLGAAADDVYPQNWEIHFSLGHAF